ncbi:hypothetical protein ACE1CI_09260 [Aerosakkonemataceae cyanobacterium BLCC-F50]|uniref:Uncharacterized protein n=1 Tax=Floridaenema flaviceps BLCC-F50 TaxID=3153642 RepID=A0ABV4XPS7_9CYAN
MKTQAGRMPAPQELELSCGVGILPAPQKLELSCGVGILPAPQKLEFSCGVGILPAPSKDNYYHFIYLHRLRRKETTEVATTNLLFVVTTLVVL